MKRLLLAASAVALVTALLYLPGVDAGLLADDHFFDFVLHDLPAEHPFHNLFALVDTRDEVRVFRDHGVLPWWAADDMRIVFFRPVASFTHWLDARLFGRDALPMHVVSIGWYLATVALVWRVFARFFAPQSRALLFAVAVFALDDAHAVNVQWIASRNDLVAASFLLVAVLGLFRLREGRSRANLALVFGGFGAALLSKETSIVFPVIALAHVAFVPGAEGPDARARLRARAGLLAAIWGFALVYLLLYVRAGFGPNTLYYLHPLRSPERWATALLETGAAHLSILATGVPLHALAPDPVRTIPAAVALCGVVTAGTLALGCRFLRADRGAWFFAVWTLGGLVVVTTGFPDSRLLFVPSIGFSFLVARLAEAMWTARGTFRPARAAILGLAALHLALAPAVVGVSVGVMRGFRGHHDALVDALRDTIDYDHLTEEPVHVFVLGFDKRETSTLATLQFVHELPLGADVRPLLTAAGVPYATRVDRAFRAANVSYHPLSLLPAVDVRVVAADTLVLTAPDGDFFPTVFERLYRTSNEMRVGASRKLPHFTATIDAVEDERVTSVRFTFQKPLASADYRFLRFRDGAWSVERFDTLLAAHDTDR